MKEVNLILTNQEAQVLVQLIDIAVKAGGINVAEAALTFVKRIENEMVVEKPE